MCAARNMWAQQVLGSRNNRLLPDNVKTVQKTTHSKEGHALQHTRNVIRAEAMKGSDKSLVGIAPTT